jgi:hypothetical protein
MKHLFGRNIAFVVVMLFACSLAVSAQSAGYDLLQTGSGSQVDLSTVSNPSCGTWPNLGSVTLNGRPFDGSIGNTDTIMHRTATSQSNVFNVSVYALSLESANPIIFNGQSADVYVTINNSGGNISQSSIPQYGTTSSSGTVTINSGGTFDSSITINAEVIIVSAGQDPSNSANVLCHAGAQGTTLSGTASSYSATAPAGYPSSSTYPSGGFYPQPVHSAPLHSHIVQPATCTDVSTIQPNTLTASKTAVRAKPSRAAATTTTTPVAVTCISSQ